MYRFSDQAETRDLASFGFPGSSLYQPLKPISVTLPHSKLLPANACRNGCLLLVAAK